MIYKNDTQQTEQIYTNAKQKIFTLTLTRCLTRYCYTTTKVEIQQTNSTNEQRNNMSRFSSQIMSQLFTDVLTNGLTRSLRR